MLNFSVLLSDGCEFDKMVLQELAGDILLVQTGFAFDQGKSMSEHTAPFDAVAHVLEGEITVSGKPHCVKQREIRLMPAQQPRALKALTRFKMIRTTIRSW